MIAGLDSAFPPSASAVAQAYASGVRLWAGYFWGPNIYNGWSETDFDRVKAGGLATFAYCSGWSDPAAMKAQGESWGLPICLDVEGGIRAAGLWMPSWLATAGSGLYGNLPVHAGLPAAFHVLAAYPGYGDPQGTWNQGPRPSGPCGWQWTGTHTEFGVSVDRGDYDDAFGLAFGPGSGSLGGFMAALTDEQQQDLLDYVYRSFNLLLHNEDRVGFPGVGGSGAKLAIQAQLDRIEAKGGANVTVDNTAVLTAIADLKAHPAVASDPVLMAKVDALSKHLGVGTP